MAEKSKKLVLVVDDEADVVTYLSAILEDHGYRTAVAANGAEAMEAVKKERPALISLDITMPEQSGVRFYRNIKENPQYKDIPVLIVTGVTPEFEKFISTRRQVPPPDGYLSKPIQPEQLVQAVEKLIGH